MFHGADVEALRAAQVGSGGTVGVMVGTLQTAARSMQWQGEDAHEFRERLEQAVTDAEQVSDQLRGRGDELRSLPTGRRAPRRRAAGRAGAAEYVDIDEAFIWWWEDGGKWPLQDRTDIRDDIPIDDPSEFGIAAMNQRGIPNCVTIALLGGLSEQDAEFFMNNLEQVSPGVYEVTLFENGRPVVHTVEGDVLPGARGSEAASWMTLYEAAQRARGRRGGRQVPGLLGSEERGDHRSAGTDHDGAAQCRDRRRERHRRLLRLLRRGRAQPAPPRNTSTIRATP